jgi:adenine-specific DNA-methyltransferase
MARKRRSTSSPDVKTTDYRHTGQKRTNIPPAKIAGEGKVPVVPKVRYHYNPHLPPVLRFDPKGDADQLHELVNETGRRALTAAEQKVVAEAIHHYEPWLEWAGKREEHEKAYFEVDPVALHIHERVSAQAIVRGAMREDVQRDIFADPQQPYQEAIQFYKHDVDWANRLILGDSLQVMSSLARRENLAGKVQMIYVDPPYGIKFSSNFQPEIGKRDVKDKDQDLSREAEMIRAYRDTWQLGVHSYLTYLRNRLVVARGLLSDSGSLFVQISDENLHHVRELLDDVMGKHNFCSIITFAKTSGQTDNRLASVSDYLLWYARNRSTMKYRQIYTRKVVGGAGSSAYRRVLLVSGERRSATSDEATGLQSLPNNARLYRIDNLTSQSPGTRYTVKFASKDYYPKGYWKTEEVAMPRLLKAERVESTGKENLYYVRFIDDFAAFPLADTWSDTVIAGFASNKAYVVETSTKVVERCVLMTTDPGDLVVDPTCGSGTTPYVAEQWGRRWIAVDTSRVALAIARQRLLTARFEHYRTRGPVTRAGENPSNGFNYGTLSHITLSSIAQNANLDPIFAKNAPPLEAALVACNKALKAVMPEIRRKLAENLKARPKREQTEADRRRWDLPEQFEHWNVPFDTDSDWPKALHGAVIAYRKAWRAKMDEVNKCIADNAEQEELVDQPEVAKGVLRVSGPFTVEGVRPEELSLGEEGLFDATPNEFEEDGAQIEIKNINAYLTRMVQHLRGDGLTFIGNKQKKFSRLEPLFEAQTGGIIHAEGIWDGGDLGGPNTVAVGFGPQYGPVTALQVEELIRAAKRYDELVVAGFSFDAEATEVIQSQGHPKLQIHQAYIRPDINPGMEGLLKDTPNSQLFTVFGQPEVEVKPTKDGEWVAKLAGVDIYDPIENAVRSSGADKVAAWFLDSDYDGRCFCITQAFFPNQDAWEKIAKVLGSSADAEAFESFSGIQSLPFKAGKHKRIAVKVIDPRGNEVMAVRQLEA